MPDWSPEILNRRFRAREVARLTGVPEDRQRLLASRHFDFREAVEPEGGHRRWSWEGVQTLAAFTEVLADLGNADRALALVKGEAQTMSYQFDSSSASKDVLFAFFFDHSLLPGAQVTDVDGFRRLFEFRNIENRPLRSYTYNLSAMQRRLLDRLAPLNVA